MIWTSNIAGFNSDDNRPVDGGAKEQTIAALQNLEKILIRSDSSLDQLVRITLYVRYREDLEKIEQGFKDVM